MNHILFIDIEVENYIRFSLTESIAVLISTAILVLIGAKFLWHPVMQYIAQRQKFIADNVNEAKQINVDAKEREVQLNKELSEIKSKSQNIISQAEEQAKVIHDDVVSKSKKEASEKIINAEKQIELMHHNAQESMKQEIIEVAFEVAEKIVDKEIDKNKHKDLVDNFIKDVK